MISGERGLVGKRMTRVYYHLEEPGHRRLQELVHEYQVMTRGVFQIIQKDDRREGRRLNGGMRRAGRGIVCRTVYCVRQGKPQHHDPQALRSACGFFIKQSKKFRLILTFLKKPIRFPILM